MQHNMVFFKKFVNIQQAIEVIEVLKENNIQNQVIDDSLNTDVTFAGNSFDKLIEIRILPSDFVKANKAISESYDKLIEQFDGEHYLYDFSTKELLEVVSKPDEWCSFDIKLAQNILNKKGSIITDEKINEFQELRLKEISIPKEADKDIVAKGYAYSFVGGIIGIYIGYKLAFNKKVLSNGEIINTFNDTERKHGIYIMIIGIISLLLFGYFLYGKDYL